MTTSGPDSPLDDLLVARLAALEARVPATALPALPAEHGRRRRVASLVLAPVLVLAVAATAVAGGAIVRGLAESHPGVENPGQPLAGAALECMTPPQAQAYLTAHGFTDVDWQVERGDATGKAGSSVHQATAPEHGFVVPGSILDDGSLIMVVDQRIGAQGSGACAFETMP